MRRVPSRVTVVVIVAIALVVVPVGILAWRHNHESAACAEFRDYLARDAAIHTEGPDDYPYNVLGDGISAGAGLRKRDHVWTHYLSSHVAGEVTVDAAEGTGFVSAGPCGDYAFKDRLAHLERIHTGSLMLQGGNADVGEDPAAVEAAAIDLITRSASDYCHIIGPVDAPSQSGEAAIDAALRRAAQDRCSYISMLDTELDFQPDGGRLSARGQDLYSSRVVCALDC